MNSDAVEPLYNLRSLYLVRSEASNESSGWSRKQISNNVPSRWSRFSFGGFLRASLLVRNEVSSSLRSANKVLLICKKKTHIHCTTPAYEKQTKLHWECISTQRERGYTCCPGRGGTTVIGVIEREEGFYSFACWRKEASPFFPQQSRSQVVTKVWAILTHTHQTHTICCVWAERKRRRRWTKVGSVILRPHTVWKGVCTRVTKFVSRVCSNCLCFLKLFYAINTEKSQFFINTHYFTSK